MGPQLKGCGRQLGLKKALPSDAASMGPQLKGCGRAIVAPQVSENCLASMGPQLKGCGRTSMSLRPRAHGPLQWGRSLRAAEGSH